MIKRDGLAKSIGVCNFNSQQLTKLMQVATIKPVINQVECHPLLCQKPLLEFCRKNGIFLMAYSPLGGSPPVSDASAPVQVSSDVRDGLFANPLIKKLAAKYQKSIGQLLLRFQVQRQVIPIPKTVTKSRMAENLNVFDFELAQSDLEELEALNQNARYVGAQQWAASKYFPFAAEF